MHIDSETQSVSAGDAIVIPGEASQWIENTGPATLRFTVLVSPPWTAADDERLE